MWGTWFKHCYECQDGDSRALNQAHALLSTGPVDCTGHTPTKLALLPGSVCRPASCEGPSLGEGVGEVCSPGAWSELQSTLTFLASGRGAVPHPRPGPRRSGLQPTYACPQVPTPGQGRSPASSSLSRECISGSTHIT